MSYSQAIARMGSMLSPFGISDLALDDALAAVNPLWSVRQLRARVVERIRETSSSCSLVLQAGPGFRGFVPGQYVMLGVEIAGAWHRRAYSARWIDRSRRRFAVTIQRQPHGLVSNWLNQHVEAGDLLEISQAGGTFVLPESVPQNVLMIAGGSGITPCRAMLDELRERSPSTRVTLVYFARSRAERIFALELERLATQWSSLRYLPLDSSANSLQPATGGAAAPAHVVLNRELLDHTVPGWATMPAWCCGPAPLMDAAVTLWTECGAREQLRTESFGAISAAAVHRDAAAATQRHRVTLRRSSFQDASFHADPGLSLLQAGEASGLKLPHGCRQGICHECTCRLDEGSVVDMVTGERHHGEGQTIRLCVSAPLSDVTLDAEV